MVTQEEIRNAIRSDLEFKNFQFTDASEQTAAPKEIEALEEKLGYELPTYYRSFLAVANGGTTNFNSFVLGRGLAYLNYFFGLYSDGNEDKDVRTILDRYGRWIPADFVPVARVEQSSKADLLCVGLISTVRDKVFYWHDAERQEILMQQSLAGEESLSEEEINERRQDNKPRFGNVTYLDSDILAFTTNLLAV